MPDSSSISNVPVGPSGGGVGMATLLGRRQALPRPLLFLEPAAPFAIAGRDPFERYAELLGLSPVSGPVEQIAPPRTDAFTIARNDEGLVLRHPLASDLVPAAPAVLQTWWNSADGEALVVVAHGLGLSRDDPPIDEALQFRPAWAAVASIEKVAQQPPRSCAAASPGSYSSAPHWRQPRLDGHSQLLACLETRWPTAAMPRVVKTSHLRLSKISAVRPGKGEDRLPVPLSG